MPPETRAPPEDVPTMEMKRHEDVEDVESDWVFDSGDASSPFGDWGKPCADGQSCESGYCIQISMDESVCTVTCLEECPEDWVCKGIGTEIDPTFICMPPQGRPCGECETDEECLLEGHRCVQVSSGGKFCLTDCADGQPCPEHYTCTGVKMDGFETPLPLCYPDTGSCVCDWGLNGTADVCTVENVHGKCFGEQVCDGADGWTECDAPEPAPETCDGTDEDCDGLVDEGMNPMPCIIENEFGSCKGIQACDGVDGFVCDALMPAAETCDGVDQDCDGLVDEDFADSDYDGLSDCIDPDDDGDGVVDDADNCPLVYNSIQSDLDADGLGDACDEDDDGDEVPDVADNCPAVANADQGDQDNDGLGDGCDDDADGDGTVNVWDCAPDDPAVYPGAPEICDGVDNNCNIFVDEGYPDADGDNVADCSDADDDNDGDPDETDCEPLDPTVGHGLDEECDGKDNDCNGLVDDGFPDTDQDGAADCVDLDSDDDGILDFQDNCPTSFNPSQINNDNDALGDACDKDDDNDGIPDDGDDSGDTTDAPCTGGEAVGCDDNCPVTPNQTQSDLDGDLMGDACDPDADGDGFANELDCAPFDDSVYPAAGESCNGFDDNCNGLVDEGYPDFDDDMQADCVDADDDSDQDPDETDCSPLDPMISNWADEVCDGVDNNCDGEADEGCPPAAFRLEMVQTILKGTDGFVKGDIVIGRPVSRLMENEEAGYRIRLGY